jgi:hypothetical protein
MRLVQGAFHRGVVSLWKVSETHLFFGIVASVWSGKQANPLNEAKGKEAARVKVRKVVIAITASKERES